MGVPWEQRGTLINVNKKKAKKCEVDRPRKKKQGEKREEWEDQ